MAKMPEFPFDPSQIADFFKDYDLSKYFPQSSLPDIDPAALMAAQKKNMDALVEANKAAAAGYQDLFKKQMAMFEETLTAAQKQAANLDTTVTPGSAEKQGEYVKAAFEKAVENMTLLAQEAQKANASAFSTVSARIEENMKEMKDLAGKFTG